MNTRNSLIGSGVAPDNLTELLDRPGALARLGGNAQLLAEVATLFLEDCPQWQAELGNHLRHRNGSALYFTAHLLRGSLSALGAYPIATAARELEWFAMAGDFKAAATTLATLETGLERLKPVLANIAAVGT